jgi:hypothetical protein
VPTTRVKLTTASHDLPRVQPRAQQGASPRPTSGLSLGLGRRSPPRPTPGLSLGLRRRSLPRPTSSLGLGLGLDLRRSHILARPQPRPREKSPPRPTSASDRLRHWGYIITLPLASCLKAMKEQDRCPIWITPVTGNDGSPRASMTSMVLSSLQKQGNVSRIHAAPPAALLQGSSTSPTATLAHIQGSSTSPSATLAHSYTPFIQLDHLLVSIKGDVQDLPEGKREGGGGASRGRQSGRNAEEANSDSSPQGQTLSLSLSLSLRL